MGVKWDALEMFEELSSEEVDKDSVHANVNVSSENTSEHSSGDVIDPFLSLKLMSTKADMESSLDEIEKQLITLMSTNKLNVSPTYTVMDVRGLSESTGTDKVSAPSPDITSPMTLRDYDTYNFTDTQVKA